ITEPATIAGRPPVRIRDRPQREVVTVDVRDLPGRDRYGGTVVAGDERGVDVRDLTADSVTPFVLVEGVRLVRPLARPRPPVNSREHVTVRGLARVLLVPLGELDRLVGLDLLSPTRQRPDNRGQFRDLSVRVER